MRRPGFDVEPRYAPNGRWIAFQRLRTTRDGHFQQAVFVVRAAGGPVRRLTPWKQNAEHPWSPDSKWILFNLSPDGTIEAMRLDGRGRHTVLPATEGLGGHKPWFSPDGTRILFTCETQGTLPKPPKDHNEDICVMDADGSNIVNLTNTPETFRELAELGPRAELSHHCRQWGMPDSRALSLPAPALIATGAMRSRSC
jgi:Tol biopolymer transport system component